MPLADREYMREAHRADAPRASVQGKHESDASFARRTHRWGFWLMVTAIALAFLFAVLDLVTLPALICLGIAIVCVWPTVHGDFRTIRREDW